MGYQQFKDYYYGSADLTIGEVVAGFSNFFENLSLLLTSLDSNSNLIAYGEWLRKDKSSWNVSVIGSSVWIPAEHVQEFLLAPNTLSHFDEMYCVTQPPPADFQIGKVFTSDRCDFSNEVPKTFFDIFGRLGALRYLSDGCGLNFACESAQIAERIAEVEQRVAR